MAIALHNTGVKMGNRTRGFPNEEPPSKGILGIGSADISLDDIKGKFRVGFWDRLTQSILYPAGGAICTRCLPFLIHFQE